MVTVITTTGYSTADFAQWPMFSKAVAYDADGNRSLCIFHRPVESRCHVCWSGIKCVKREIVQLAHPKSVGIILHWREKVSSDVRARFIFILLHM